MIDPHMSNHAYHERDEISSSDVKAASKSLAHWKGAVRSETPALALGTAFHELTLEPDEGRVIRGPETRRGKSWSEAKEEAEAQGKVLLTQSDYDICNAMAESALRHPRVASIVRHPSAMIENSIFVTCPETGLGLRCRPDCYIKEGGLLLDLKSTLDAGPSEREFQKHIWSYNYDLQMAFYRYVLAIEKLPVTHCIFAAVEKSPPYAVGVHVLSNGVLDYAHQRMMNILRRIKKAQDEQSYPTDWPEVNIIELPEWLKAKEQ